MTLDHTDRRVGLTHLEHTDRRVGLSHLPGDETTTAVLLEELVE
jgi:hypothetical protein